MTRKTKATFTCFVIALLTSKFAVANQPHIESAEKVIACAYPKNPEAKAEACNALNESERRILNCATKSVNGSRMPNCKLLSDYELKSVPIVDAHRPHGTHFNLAPVRKLGNS